ncbi:MAG: glycosyltransferase family 9 protein [Parvibaculaceae bacterium]|nr:glycosyltransferase family 9 protein [Parvibaculaceae bacterium]
MTPEQVAARKILVIKHGAFGDIVQAEGAFHDIRENHPAAEITVLTTRSFVGLFERCPWVDAVMTDPRDPRWRLDLMARLGQRLKAGHFDFVYDLQNSTRTATYFRRFFKGVPWSGTAPGCSHPHTAPDPKTIRTLDRLAGQLEEAGLTVRHSRTPDVSWMADAPEPTFARFKIVPPYIVLIPGSSASRPEKRWPHYAALASLLIDAGHRVVTEVGPDEHGLVSGMPGIIAGGPGQGMTLFELAALLKRARYVVGNDTGPSHLAAHLGVPGLALFGPKYDPHWTGIDTPGFDVIQVDDLAALSPERVAAQVESRLHDLLEG